MVARFPPVWSLRDGAARQVGGSAGAHDPSACGPDHECPWQHSGLPVRVPKEQVAGAWRGVLGTEELTMTDEAKMIGMTPAALTRSGMKFFAASLCRPRAMVRCGIWIITLRAAIVMAIVPATTPTITIPRTTRENGPTA